MEEVKKLDISHITPVQEDALAAMERLAIFELQPDVVDMLRKYLPAAKVQEAVNRNLRVAGKYAYAAACIRAYEEAQNVRDLITKEEWNELDKAIREDERQKMYNMIDKMNGYVLEDGWDNATIMPEANGSLLSRHEVLMEIKNGTGL